MILIAIEMLLGDRVKFLMLICALAFSTLLMTQQCAVFLGVMRLTTVILRNTNVPIWVADPRVEQVGLYLPLRDIDLDRVKSVNGVEWAVPFFDNLLRGKLYNGHFRTMELIGVDSSTLVGVPPTLIKGKVEDLRQDKAVIIDETGLQTLSRDQGKPMDIGDVFDLNDHEVKIVGVLKSDQSFFSYPFIYTTYERALEIFPPVRKNLSFILVNPVAGMSVDEVVKNIEQQTGLKAITSDEFAWDTIVWFFQNTGIPVSFAVTILIGFIVGVAVSGQTFYAFVNDNIGNIAALKVMGASDSLIKSMLLVQAFIAGFIGYGIGLLFSIISGVAAFYFAKVPFYLVWQVLAATFVLIVLICLLTAFLSILRVNKLDAAEVFRA